MNCYGIYKVGVTLYGIKNCDTVKKARKWLDQHDIDYRFHDFRTDGINRDLIAGWLKDVDWEKLINTRGTTWRRINDNEKTGLNKSRAVALMLKQPALIKRPVLARHKHCYVGFDEREYRKFFMND